MTNDELRYAVERARQGDMACFGALVRRFQDATVGYAYASLGDFHMAQDAAQEAWLRVWIDLPTLREPAAFAGWLRQITATCCSRLTRGKRLPVLPLELADGVPCRQPLADERLDSQQRLAEVRAAIQALPERQREAVLLYYMSEWSQGQMAAFLDVPEGTVRKRLFDARQQLRQRMMDMVKETVETNAPSRDEGFTRRVLEGIRATTTRKAGWSSLLSTFQPMLQAAGVTFSVPRLAGIFGHAFSFYMHRAPGEVWQAANIDWWLLWRNRDLVGFRFDEFQGTNDQTPCTYRTPEQRRELEEEAWRAVVGSIDRGLPAVAWTPMTVAQRDAGIMAWEWALLVGYDESSRTYTVRAHGQSTPYEVPYNGFGHCDPVEWFDVMVLGEPAPVDDAVVARRALEQAVAYAHGTVFPPEEACYPIDGLGLAAYELWRELLADSMSAGFAEPHAGILEWSREAAAGFCREMAEAVPSWSQALGDAVGLYTTEAGQLRRLRELCEQEGLEGKAREEAVAVLSEALETEREAVKVLEEAVAA